LTATATLQAASGLLLNLCLAWMLAALLARRWLRGDGQAGERAWAPRARAALETSMPAAALAALLAGCAALWAAAAAMADVPLGEAGEAFSMLLSRSTYGLIGAAGGICLLSVAALHWMGRRLPGRDWIALVLLGGFAFSRAANSHAAEHGLFSTGVWVEWLHLLLICGWVGAVAVAGWMVLPLAAERSGAPARYLELLSDAATFALAGIAASGAYNAWRVFGTWAQVGTGAYETTLAVKLLLVALAVAVGGYNKFIGFPDAAVGRTGAMTRITGLLQIESVLLAGAMLAAVMLAAMPPPASI
jgi:putative copper export protein